MCIGRNTRKALAITVSVSAQQCRIKLIMY